jgi:hypothetical protein
VDIGTEDPRWQEHMLHRHKEYFNLAFSFLQCADKLQDEFVRKRINREELGAEGFVLSFLFAKGYKTTKAALLLCKSGYPEDALILARSNLEVAFRALYIFKDEEKATEKAEAFIKYDAIDLEEKLQKLLNLCEDEDNSKAEFLEALSRIQKEHPETQEECAKVRKLAKKSVLELAGDDKLLYRLYHSFYWRASVYAHNRFRSSEPYVLESNEGIKFWVAPTEKGSRDVLLYLCLFLWYLMDEFNSLCQLGSENTLTAKWTELNELFKKTDPQN